MVRLKVLFEISIHPLSMNFNSNMVRLKGNIMEIIAASHSKFQFQYGSIKREVEVPEITDYLNFNSNMVRLKVRFFTPFCSNRSYFNSNMVRLKVWNPYRPPVVPWWFQFQYGSIKRSSEAILTNHLSTFQFQYGSIKRLSYRTRLIPRPHFNSNMVRLKAYLVGLRHRLQLLFQFQYGSIKSCL